MSSAISFTGFPTQNCENAHHQKCYNYTDVLSCNTNPNLTLTIILTLNLTLTATLTQNITENEYNISNV